MNQIFVANINQITFIKWNLCSDVAFAYIDINKPKLIYNTIS